jgi:hypothetical protein
MEWNGSCLWRGREFGINQELVGAKRIDFDVHMFGSVSRSIPSTPPSNKSLGEWF